MTMPVRGVTAQLVRRPARTSQEKRALRFCRFRQPERRLPPGRQLSSSDDLRRGRSDRSLAHVEQVDEKVVREATSKVFGPDRSTRVILGRPFWAPVDNGGECVAADSNILHGTRKESPRIMKGSPKVIETLNEALHEELTAINQYFLHAEMCENWHYDRLGELIKKQSIGEMKHAEVLIERILFLDGTPNLTKHIDLTVGKSVKEQIESDLKLEIEAVAMYNRAIETARQEADNASRELFERLLRDEEEHVDWLEAQVHQMKELGYERYLSQQIGEEE
jgi:bacterioferritin